MANNPILEQLQLLRQLQHILLIRDEELRIGAGERGDELGQSIARLVERLDVGSADLYRRLSARNRVFMSPVSKGNCSACCVRIPTATLQHVIAVDRLEVCPSCGRLLCMPSAKATGVRQGGSDTKFLLSRFSAAALMIPDLAAHTSEEAVAELAEALVQYGAVSDRDAVVSAAVERERILTTDVGNGMAFPHMRGVEEGVLTFAAGISRAGLEWGGDSPVHLIVLTVFPLVASPFYLKLLAAFARSFENGGKLPFVLASTDAKTMWKELNKATRVAIKGL